MFENAFNKSIIRFKCHAVRLQKVQCNLDLVTSYLVTNPDLVTVFAETKSVTKSRLHCIFLTMLWTWFNFASFMIEVTSILFLMELGFMGAVMNYRQARLGETEGLSFLWKRSCAVGCSSMCSSSVVILMCREVLRA